MADLLTFDCYGTLIDWEGGMRRSLEPVVAKHGRPAPWETITGRYIEVEMEVEKTYRPYRDVLPMALGKLFEEYGITLDEMEQRAFVDSIRQWSPFEETREILEKLKSKGKKLAILSNIDNDIIADAVKLIGVQFDWIVTAEDVGSYKPAHGHWEEILKRSGLPKERILHVAASLEHDVRPCNDLGFRTVWINRNDETADKDNQPDVELVDLRGLPAAAAKF